MLPSVLASTRCVVVLQACMHGTGGTACAEKEKGGEFLTN